MEMEKKDIGLIVLGMLVLTLFFASILYYLSGDEEEIDTDDVVDDVIDELEKEEEEEDDDLVTGTGTGAGDDEPETDDDEPETDDDEPETDDDDEPETDDDEDDSVEAAFNSEYDTEDADGKIVGKSGLSGNCEGVRKYTKVDGCNLIKDSGKCPERYSETKSGDFYKCKWEDGKCSFDLTKSCAAASVDEPAAEEPATEEPAAEEPAAEEPAVEEPAVESVLDYDREGILVYLDQVKTTTLAAISGNSQTKERLTSAIEDMKKIINQKNEWVRVQKDIAPKLDTFNIEASRKASGFKLDVNVSGGGGNHFERTNAIGFLSLKYLHRKYYNDPNFSKYRFNVWDYKAEDLKQYLMNVFKQNADSSTAKEHVKSLMIFINNKTKFDDILDVSRNDSGYIGSQRIYTNLIDPSTQKTFSSSSVLLEYISKEFVVKPGSGSGSGGSSCDLYVNKRGIIMASNAQGPEDTTTIYFTDAVNYDQKKICKWGTTVEHNPSEDSIKCKGLRNSGLSLTEIANKVSNGEINEYCDKMGASDPTSEGYVSCEGADEYQEYEAADYCGQIKDEDKCAGKKTEKNKDGKKRYVRHLNGNAYSRCMWDSGKCIEDERCTPKESFVNYNEPYEPYHNGMSVSSYKRFSKK